MFCKYGKAFNPIDFKFYVGLYLDRIRFSSTHGFVFMTTERTNKPMRSVVWLFIDLFFPSSHRNIHRVLR